MKALATNPTLLAAIGSIVGTTITGVVCALPLTAILLGIGGLGWLTQYSHLRVPASLATLVLVVYGFCRTRTQVVPCSAARPRSFARMLLWIAALFAATVNLFEYVVLPRLG